MCWYAVVTKTVMAVILKRLRFATTAMTKKELQWFHMALWSLSLILQPWGPLLPENEEVWQTLLSESACEHGVVVFSKRLIKAHTWRQYTVSQKKSLGCWLQSGESSGLAPGYRPLWGLFLLFRRTVPSGSRVNVKGPQRRNVQSSQTMVS